MNRRWEESPLGMLKNTRIYYFNAENITGRETFLVRVHWENDWPVFNYGDNVSLQTTISDRLTDDICLQPCPSPKKWKADFDTDKLELGWYYKSMIKPPSNP